ncbi:MAG: EF-P 5-aminopentanol modification-associated protein YfmH [Oscillospiraceae bacterium]
MIEEIYSPLVRESCLKYVHKSGVTVFMYPMEKSSVTAQFAVKFGSIDNRYRIKGQPPRDIPDGTAHYLEHKLFESEENDAFSLFAETGASCNAGTSYESTMYYFSSTNDFEKNLEILLGFVQQPYFTPETVEKERGIIGQEITMYDDNPNWRVIMELLKGVYHVNPIRNDIAGTVESIADITDKLLYEVYDVFYNPANMYLSVAGNFEPKQVVEICDRCLKERERVDFETIAAAEPREVKEHYREVAMPVGKPLFAIGFKRPDSDGQEALEEYVYYNIILDALFSDSSRFYSVHRESGLVNENFRDGVFMGRGYVMPYISGESLEPKRVLEEVKAELLRAKKDGIPEQVFKRIKKVNYGDSLRGYNSVDNVADNMTYAAMSDVAPFSVIECVASADYEIMKKKLAELDVENVCLSVVNPMA